MLRTRSLSNIKIMLKVNRNDAIPRRQRWRVGQYTLSAVTCGPATGDAVVFLHGLPTSAELWRPMQFYFGQAGYNTVAPDLPGFGKTLSGSPSGASWQNSLDLIADWLKAQPHLENIWWIGHQAGCLMATQCAQRFARLTKRITLITPPTHESDIWPTSALSWMPLIIKWGLYEQVTQAHLLPNLVQRQQLAMNLANVKKLDVYLDRKVLFNEKVKDATRRQEFVNYVKNLPAQIDKKTLETAQSLRCPVQVIVPPYTRTSPIKKLWLKLRKQHDFEALKRHHCLTQFTHAGFELVSVFSGQLFAPLEKPQEIAETAMQWAQPSLREQYAKAAIDKIKVDPLPKPPKHRGVRINAALSLPPDGRPEDSTPTTAPAPLTINAK